MSSPIALTMSREPNQRNSILFQDRDRLHLPRALDRHDDEALAIADRIIAAHPDNPAGPQLSAAVEEQIRSL